MPAKNLDVRSYVTHYADVIFSFPMHKLAVYALTFGTLSFASCTQTLGTQTLGTQASQKSALDREKFYGEVWIRPGKRIRLHPGGTLYLKEATSNEIAPRSLSSFSLQRAYGSPISKQMKRNEKVYYISE